MFLCGSTSLNIGIPISIDYKTFNKTKENTQKKKTKQNKKPTRS